MALTAEKNRFITLSTMVSQRAQEFVNARTRIRNLQEADFYKMVASEGMSTADQLAYREKQLTKESDTRVPDETFVAEIRKSIADLKKIKRSEDYRNEYYASFTDLKTEKKSYDNHIAFLEDRLANTSDPALRATIQANLSEAKINQFDLQNMALINRATLAANDRSIVDIDKVIGDISKRRAQALAVNNDAEVSKWDSYLSNLRSNKAQIQIADTFNDLQINHMKKPVTSTGLLDFYKNNSTGSSSDNVSFTINGNKYNSLKEYWQGELNNYLANDFFKNYQSELAAKVTHAAQTLRPILEASLRNINSEIDGYSQQSEFKPFVDQLNQLRTAINYKGVKELSEKIKNDYLQGGLGVTAIENYNNAISKLNDLRSSYNVDVTDVLLAIQKDRADKVEAAAAQIDAVAFANKISAEEASKSISIIDVPSNRLAEMSPLDIAQNAEEKAQTGQPTELDQTYGINTPAQGTTPIPTVEPVAWTAPDGYELISGPSQLGNYTGVVSQPGSINKWGKLKPVAPPAPWQAPTGYQLISGPSQLPNFTEIISEPGSINKWGMPKVSTVSSPNTNPALSSTTTLAPSKYGW